MFMTIIPCHEVRPTTGITTISIFLFLQMSKVLSEYGLHYSANLSLACGQFWWAILRF